MMYTMLVLMLSILVVVLQYTVVESNSTSACSVTYRIYDKDLEEYYINLYGDDNLSYPPCNINIEAVVNCPTPFTGVVRMQLRNIDGTLVKAKTEKEAPYFLYGDFKGRVRSAKVQGEFTIETILNQTATDPVRFTLYPCVPSPV